MISNQALSITLYNHKVESYTRCIKTKKNAFINKNRKKFAVDRIWTCAGDPNWFLINRLNHSATTALIILMFEIQYFWNNVKKFYSLLDLFLISSKFSRKDNSSSAVSKARLLPCAEIRSNQHWGFVLFFCLICLLNKNSNNKDWTFQMWVNKISTRISWYILNR